MKSKKLLSLLLALMMMLSVVPFYASAADPIALTEANVTVWPTASGSIYFGQKISDGITLSGGEVQYEGAVVPGHFEFVDPEQRNSKGYTDLKFVPDDNAAYSVFEIANAWNVIFTINNVTPVLVDANDLPVATEVTAAGTLLGKSKISGGQVMNPYYPEESMALGYTWSWVNRREPVTKSGYYEAQIGGGGKYDKVTTMIYVKIAGDTPETSISEMPTIPELNYNPNITWADVPLTGGKAVINDNEEVSGTFAISDTWKDKVPAIGSYNVSVIFTPDDLTKASVYTMLIPVTVNKGVIKFVDENGAEIVPEITVPYGTSFGDIDNLLEKYVKGPEVFRIGFGDLESTKCTESGTYTCSVLSVNDTNYETRTELQFKIIVEARTLNPKIMKTTEGYYVQDSSGTYKPQGTFDVYIDGELYKTGVKYLVDKVAYVPEKSGVHTITFVYNPVENDNYVIEKDATITQTINLMHKLTLSDNINNSADRDVYFGDSVEISASLTTENFAGWKVTDANGNEITLDGVDNSSTKITITMPDFDITVRAKTIADDCDHLCHKDGFLGFIWKIVTFLQRLFGVQQYCDCGQLHYDAPYIDLGL